MASLSPEVERLLSLSSARLPLTKSGFQPDANVCGMHSHDAASLFPGARHDQAALAGMLLRLGCWTESHTIAQDVQSVEGSYWHAIIHRMEPDSANAGYWFRQTGKHPIFAELRAQAEEIVQSDGPAKWQLKTDWDPFLFVRWCDEARELGGQAEATAVRIQAVEWQLLFEWCAAVKQSAAR